jgi:transposase
LPHLAAVAIERVEQHAGGFVIWAHPVASEAPCPTCGRTSTRVHSRYDRKLADAAIAGQPVLVRLQVRRFFCGHGDCSAKTSAEQVDYPHKELVTRLLADTCEICRQSGEVQVHHVRKLADLGKPGPLQPLWAKAMANRRRKTLVVCASCHDQVHTGQSAAPLTQ